MDDSAWCGFSPEGQREAECGRRKPPGAPGGGPLASSPWGPGGPPLSWAAPDVSCGRNLGEREREPPWQAPLCGGQVGQAGWEGREAFQQWERSFSFLYSNEINTDTVSAERMPSSP